ncbi:MAG TPA: hypothetical protein VMK65_03000, partial [Longimicrobiales bacterium]|nr:hypothetical protein [Longimicrobiales bacterium]
MPEPKFPQPSQPDEGLTCQEFRAGHVEHMDGLLRGERAERWAAHARTCLPCARYDRTVRRACALARAMPALSASDEFRPRLQHRLFHVQDEERLSRRGSRGHVGLSVAVAGLMTALAWSPLLVEGPDPVELSPVQARAPLPETVGARSAGPWRVNLFSSQAALPGAWLNGRPAPSHFHVRHERGPTLTGVELYPAFLMEGG